MTDDAAASGESAHWIAPSTQPAVPTPQSDLPPGWAPADFAAPGPQAGFDDPVAHPSEIYGYQPPPTYANTLAAHKPGIIPLRPLGIGDVVTGSLAAITTNLRAVAPISAVIAVISALIGLLVSALADSIDVADGTALSAFGGLAALSTAAAVFLTAVLTGALAYPTSRAVEGRYPPLKRCWERLAPRLPAVLAIAAIAFVIIAVPLIAVTAIFSAAGAASSAGLAVLGALLGIVSAVALVAVTTFIVFAMPITVLEGLTPIAALRRSVALVRPVCWRVLGCLLLVALIIAIAQSVITSPTGDIADVADGVSGGIVASTTKLIASTALTALADFVTLPFLGTAITVLYTDARIRLEGFDITLIAGSGDAAPTGSP